MTLHCRPITRIACLYLTHNSDVEQQVIKNDDTIRREAFPSLYTYAADRQEAIQGAGTDHTQGSRRSGLVGHGFRHDSLTTTAIYDTQTTILRARHVVMRRTDTFLLDIHRTDCLHGVYDSGLFVFNGFVGAGSISFSSTVPRGRSVFQRTFNIAYR